MKGQQNWGTAREKWPEILYQYESKGETRTGKKAEPWVREGKVVLDINDDPVLAFKELPATISSKCEPAFLEAFTRLNEQIKIKDIRARMPRDPGGKAKADGDDPIRLGTLSMSMTRFRNKAGMITWGSRAGSTAIKDYLDTLLPAECKAQNSIKGFRNLYEHEIYKMKICNIGCYPEKARRGRDRKPSAAKRNKARDALIAKYNIAYEKFLKAQGNIVGKPEDSNNDDHKDAIVEDQEDSNVKDHNDANGFDHEHANGYSHEHANIYGPENTNVNSHEHVNIYGREDTNVTSHDNTNNECHDDGNNDDHEQGTKDGGNNDGSNNDGSNNDDGNGHNHDNNANDDHNDDDRNHSNDNYCPHDDDNESTNQDDDSLSTTLLDEQSDEGDEDAEGISDDEDEVEVEVEDDTPTNEEAMANAQDGTRISIYIENASRYNLHVCVQAELAELAHVAASSGPQSAMVWPNSSPVTVSSQSTVYQYRGIGQLNPDLTRYLIRTSREVVGLDGIHNQLLWPARHAYCRWTGASEGPRLRPEENYFDNLSSIQYHLNLYRVFYRLPLVQLPGFILDQGYTTTAHWEDGPYSFLEWHRALRLVGFPVNTLQIAIS